MLSKLLGNRTFNDGETQKELEKKGMQSSGNEAERLQIIAFDKAIGTTKRRTCWRYSFT